MARLYPIYVRRSDGKLEVASSKGGRKEPNQPTAEQMDQKPDKNGVSDYYREVLSDEAKHLDWRRKLGGMLARELQAKEKDSKDTGYILVTFPEGYRLYEHIKKSEKDGKAEIKNKTHSAGGTDRQDAYLYGHPSGRRKRYRSPADFFPHLLWLCTDENGVHDNCTCKICCPDDIESILPGTKTNKDKPMKMEIDAKPTKAAIKVDAIKSETKPSPAAQSKTPDLKPAQPAQSTQQSRSRDKQLDSQFGGYKYRQGEMVWYRRGQAWGLGIITYRQGEHGPMSYAVQPLSFPGHGQRPVHINSDDDLRPWLAWSVPRYTYDALNDFASPALYDHVDWQGLMQGRYGDGNLDIDASILAAKSIDSTYTPFNMLALTRVEQGITDAYYDGLFLGAEKIWLNEPVRLTTGTDILVIKAIVERTVHSHIGKLNLVGDIYTLDAVHHSNPNIPTPASRSNNPDLPQRLTEDLAHRNARSIQMRQIAQYWKLINRDAVVDLEHIKGRWYETSVFLPVLQEETYRQGNETGTLQEMGIYMNSRGDCMHANRDPQQAPMPRMNHRTRTRKEACGSAFPAEVRIIDELTMAPRFEGDSILPMHDQ